MSMSHRFVSKDLSRRDFVKLAAVGGVSAVLLPLAFEHAGAQDIPAAPATNGKEALRFPRTARSMPGAFPGRVVQVVNEKAIVNEGFDMKALHVMLAKALLSLTGAASVPDAWRMFVNPDQIIGIKVNPVAGKLLSTSPEIVHVIIRQLEAAGIPAKNIVIWDRRAPDLAEAGFTPAAFPGIRFMGTEQKDDNGSYCDPDGRQYGERMIDRAWYYWADVEEKYDAETLQYMINEGKFSYFSRICTKDVDCIINVPILKNAGPTVTLCLKNLAFGSISNTQRLHKQLWAETCAEVPAFPPLRDKVVLNIVDGIRGCYNGGPAANQQFICNFNTLLVGTDPVAVDRIGYDIVLKKRLEEKVQKEESEKGRRFIELAQGMKLGVGDMSRITLERLTIP
jgi:hypothetical protein